jgi:shikimate dehydrogenase
VLGAGGSARAAVWALREAGAAEVSIWNRTAQRATTLARELDARAVAAVQPADLLINCTSVGLQPEPQELAALALSADRLADYGVVVDLVYRDGRTALLEAAAGQGVRTIDGLEILVAQGALSLELWTGRQAPLQVMRAAARAER